MWLCALPVHTQQFSSGMASSTLCKWGFDYFIWNSQREIMFVGGGAWLSLQSNLKGGVIINLCPIQSEGKKKKKKKWFHAEKPGLLHGFSGSKQQELNCHIISWGMLSLMTFIPQDWSGSPGWKHIWICTSLQTALLDCIQQLHLSTLLLPVSKFEGEAEKHGMIYQNGYSEELSIC